MAEQDALGQRLAGDAHTDSLWWPRLITAYPGVIPPYPGVDVIEPAFLPQPPQLNPKHVEPQHALRIAVGYRCAVEHAYGQCFLFRNATQLTLLADKHFPALVEAVPKMLEYKLAPAAWTAFSIEVWRRYVVQGRDRSWDSTPSERRTRKDSPPPVKWVFAGKRLEERTDWFAFVESKFRGGRMVISPAHHELLRRHNAMRADLFELCKSEPALLETVQAIVKKHYPDTTVKRLTAKAEEDTLVQQDQWTKDLARGKWLW